jgi:hypothetical protein
MKEFAESSTFGKERVKKTSRLPTEILSIFSTNDI